MALRLHWSPDSANLPVRLALEGFGLAYEGVRLDRARREQDGAAFRRLNPQGLIPVLEDGDLALFETGAILLHLADRAGRLGPDGPPADAPAPRAAFLSWLFFLSNTVHADLRLAFHPERYLPPEAEAALVAGVGRRLRGHLWLIEDRLGSGPLAGAPSLLEGYLGCCLRWAGLYPRGRGPLLESLAPWPRTEAAMAAIEAAPPARRAFAAEAIPGPCPITRPEPPDLPEAEVTG